MYLIYIFIFTFRYNTVAQQKWTHDSFSGSLTFSTEVAGAMSEEGKTLSEIKTQVVPLPKSSFPTMVFPGDKIGKRITPVSTNMGWTIQPKFSIGN